MFNNTKRQPIVWEKIFTYPTLEKGLIFKTYKELKKKNWLSKEQIIQLKMEYRPKQRTLNI